ncbi:DUF4271 domain-containing protein [Arachidicoccus ginsenosidivorans]|jgi:hypothetical protein|uniref:DUF4271 domain-containing protein n=1 Tax=Arachidicoccus ginsenosidivorans TaxID=496057 RepID=A0A5B8VKQ9_9BACT|nr:DUF4271 domain-containing protein [Arachidicoccus ginsenosidivorans]QEC71196.1 DUF4271 domain-containing protein [Arachidicoccus ginsenosidivorans]
MKQLWIILIAVGCSLTVYGQQRHSDTTAPKQSTGQKVATKDSGRAGHAVSSQQTKGRDTSKKQPVKSAVGKLSSDTNTNKTSRLQVDSTRITGQDSLKRKASLGVATKANHSGDSTSPIKLSPEQEAARQKQQDADRLKALKDSIYKAHTDAIRERLAKQAALNPGNQPDYTIFFPDYFYQNSSSTGDTSALVSFHNYKDRDLLFYAFLGIAFLLGLIKVIFPRYFNQVFWFFLHPNDRKNNVSDQIRGQNILPSLLLNLFFVLTGGLFLTEILRPGIPGANFWSSWLLFTGLLTGVYLVKYLVILLSGWVFGAPIAATIYNQVVFSINKIIGLLLLPATLLISYGTDQTLGQVLTAVLVIISILLIYRYIASFLLIKGKLKVSAFHFILYLCAVEIIPLLLVYKVLLTNIGRFV